MDNWNIESSQWECGYCGNIFTVFGIPVKCPKCGSTNASSLPYVEYDFAKIPEGLKKAKTALDKAIERVLQ